MTLREVPAYPGSPYMVLVSNGEPTAAERVEMAKRVQQHAGRGAYVQLRMQHEATTTQPTENEQVMNAKTTGSNEQTAAPEATNKTEQTAKEPAKQETVVQTAQQFLAERGVKPKRAKRKAAAKPAAKATAAKPAAKAAPKPAAEPKSKGGRPAKETDPDQKYRVVKDNTRSGHMKVFMAKAAELKTFTRSQLVGATKAKVSVERAERYFDYCLYKGLVGAVK